MKGNFGCQLFLWRFGLINLHWGSRLVIQLSASFCHICRQILCFCRQKVLYPSFCHLCGRNRFLPAKSQPCGVVCSDYRHDPDSSVGA